MLLTAMEGLPVVAVDELALLSTCPKFPFEFSFNLKEMQPKESVTTAASWLRVTV